MKEEILGVSIGGTIMDGVEEGNSSVRPFSLKLTDHSIEGLQVLKNRFGKIFLISICKERARWEIIRRLRAGKFLASSGIPEDNMFFTNNISEAEAFCRSFEISHFVSNSLKMLVQLPVEHLYLFRPKMEDTSYFISFYDRVRSVNSWPDAIREFKLTWPEPRRTKRARKIRPAA